jgi:DNA (cytosine-5)-methyltransferase 1
MKTRSSGRWLGEALASEHSPDKRRGRRKRGGQARVRRSCATLENGLVVDLFAGGGGASTGVRAAIGRDPDYAFNHDELAMSVFKDNHPATTVFPEDVWKRRPLDVTKGKPVFLLWASPDCRHFSAAKGGKPKNKGVRALAHVVVEWARETQPTLIFVENVSEFQKWGPLYEVGHRLPDGRVLEAGDKLVDQPIPDRKGETFWQWVGKLELLGYKVEWKVLDASSFGAPTKRRRLFIIARRDGEPIIWPKPTHGKAEGLMPLRTAAECIDWSIPCPSIFERKKPLARKTEWRIAEGIRRFVLENPEPFVIGCGGRAGQTPPTPGSAPMGTITTKADRALVVPQLEPLMPFVARTAHGDVDKSGKRRGRGSHPPDEPLPTVTASNDFAIVAPSLMKVNHGGDHPRGESLEEPLSTVTASQRGHALVTPVLVQTGYGERDGQAARVLDLGEPLGTVMATGQKHALVTAWLAKHFGGVVGHEMTQPMGAITSVDHHSVVTSTLVKLRGECSGADISEPMPTVTAGGNHVAEVRAFLMTYYSNGSQWADPGKPMPTITTKHRMGIVTVHGVDYQIVDIGMRMLEPEELLAAQFGRFAAGYSLSKAKTKRDKVRLIGNSVAPECAEAVVRANVGRVAPMRKAA